MSSNFQSPFTGLGPFQDMFSAYTSSLGSGPQGFDTFFRNLTRCQLEMQGLMSRRAQAYLELPTRISQCRTPQELVQEQTRFWQMAFEQYSECSRKMMGAWAQLLHMPIPGSMQQDGQPTGGRDYLSFPDQRPGNGVAGPQVSRRVA
ncbi:MAG: phasin family protein [Hyphomicrobiaceae bacterium]